MPFPEYSDFLPANSLVQLLQDLMNQRYFLQNADPARRFDTKIPNVYRGPLQPDFESGNSLPLIYNPKKPMAI
jgi:hypothetical protein